MLAVTKGIPKVQLSHAAAVRSVLFDDPNLVSAGGLVAVVALADHAGLGEPEATRSIEEARVAEAHRRAERDAHQRELFELQRRAGCAWSTDGAWPGPARDFRLRVTAAAARDASRWSANRI